MEIDLELPPVSWDEPTFVEGSSVCHYFLVVFTSY